MPHVSEFHATGDHDRHDLLLVAALAAGDLSGADRDHALDLTRSCGACADLHDDLVSIARATASAPPPVTERPRDFRLTPADAARLRPGGWRRLVGSFSGVGSFASRPLGIGLATLGLVGLLIGNVPVLSLGGSAAAPAPIAAGSGDALSAENAGGAQPAASAAAASGAPAYVQAAPGASSAASSAPGFGTELTGRPSPPAVPGATEDTTVRAASGSSSSSDGAAYDAGGGGKSAASFGAGDAPGSVTGTTEPAPFRPLNIVFGVAVVLGLAMLIASRLRSRSTI